MDNTDNVINNKNNKKPELVLLESSIEIQKRKGNNELVRDMEGQKKAILENRKMTYAEMRELMG